MNAENAINLLCFEDNDGDFFLLEDFLQEAGMDFTIRRVQRMKEGIELLSTWTPDLVLLDLGLPDSKGVQTFLTLQKAFPNLAVVVLTGTAEKTTGLEAVKNGAQDYLNKGDFSPALLAKTILYAIERKNLYRSLVKAREKAEEADKIKSAFLANMSHELRTPMNAIIGFSELLQYTEDADDTKKYTRIIMDNGELLLNLINDIIDISKIEAQQLKIIKAPFDLHQMLKSILDVFNESLDKSRKKKYLKLNLSVPQQIQKLSVHSDKKRLMQIISNFLSNAIKFTDSGSILFGYQIETEVIHFFVEDTGTGIEENKLDHIFDRFAQATQEAVQKGTGLGLAIAKNLAELLGGRIWATSKIGIGSVFHLTLPIECILEKHEMAASPEAKINNIVHEWQNKKVLIVEDTFENMMITKYTLKETKIQILEAPNGLDAVEIFKNNDDIDLVIMDIRLPGINGIECTKALKKIRKQVPVIMLTALTMGDEERQSKEAGCSGYLTKPVKPAYLIDYLSRFLN